MRYGSLLLVLALMVSPAAAAPKPPAYYPAEEFFNFTYNLRERVTAQVMLIAAGQQNAVPTELFQMKTFEAAREFQSANGLPATGVIDRATFDRLVTVTKPMFQLWDFREVAHPTRGRPIWMPQGMGTRRHFDKNGVAFREPGDVFRVAYNYYPGLSLERTYDWLLRNMRNSGTSVHYSVMKDGWLVISATTAAGFDEYLRYHDDGTGVLGFTAFWNNEKGVVWGERIAILMSASLGSVMNGRPFTQPPSFGNEVALQVAHSALVQAPTRSDADLTSPAPPDRLTVKRREERAKLSAAQPRPPVQRERPRPLAAISGAMTLEAAPTRPAVPEPTASAALSAEVASPSTAVMLPPKAAVDPAVQSQRYEKRVALVIGNSEYKYAPEIPNPAHDAQDAADALKKLGFEVVEGHNLSFEEFRSLIRDFSEKIKDSDLVLFFYAGHGVQVSENNYLIPIDAQLTSAGNMDIDAINVETILRAIEAQPRTKIVILDACRDNPFTRSLKRSLASARSVSVRSGLAPIQTQGGTLVAFATDPDNVAMDGSGTRNSPFTEALLKHIATPELEIETLLKRVRRDVIETTRGKQTPWSNSSLTQEVYLAKTSR